MDNIFLDTTERSPCIDFNFIEGSFVINGESYPEDVNAFYGPVVVPLKQYLSSKPSQNIEFRFELIYFNSSSAKILMGIFDALEASAKDGASISITWRYEEDDDNMQELGEEFGEDLEYAKFKLESIQE